MDRVNVTSSNILSIGYDINQGVLEVEFTTGDVYQYYNVSKFVYEEFMNSNSKGQYLHENIEYNYLYKKV